MLRLADVVRRHGPALLARYPHAVLPSHRCAMTAITHCRTPALGAHLGVCARCDYRHLLYHSCRHRACARCGYDATKRWVDQQRDRLLPVPYYHVVFTLPQELRPVVRSHQRVLIDVLFKSAYEALAELCSDERYLGGRIGALAVLHTWTRTMVYHPHVHMIVPGGALASDGSWRPVPRRRRRYLVPVKALGKLFAGKFLAMMRRRLPRVRAPWLRVGTRWVVYAKPVVQSADQVLRYLGRYVHRTAITDRALVACDDEKVTFRYRDSRDHRSKQMTLRADEFLRRFLQHVLPKGLHRVRSYGLLQASHRLTLRRLQLLLARDSKSLPDTKPDDVPPRYRCPHCRRGLLVLAGRLNAADCRSFLAQRSRRQEGLSARAPPPQRAGPSSP